MRDRTGEIYGNLQVIGFDEQETQKRTIRYGKKTNCWKCKCINCGTEITKPLSELTHYKNKQLNGCQVCRFPDLTGKRFGRLVVIGLGDYNSKTERRKWICQCDCGNVVEVASSHLINTNPNRHTTQSCGCLQKEVTSQRAKEQGIWNGASMNPETQRLYKIWDGMYRRCYDPNNKRYHQYGKRGITICDEWLNNFLSFSEWALSHGYQDNLTIDRIDNNGNYEPSNCRWATIKEQCNNTSRNRLITWNNQTHTVSEWSDISGIPYKVLYSRLFRSSHFTVEEALTISVEDGLRYIREKMKSKTN